jgi:AcrR family transcriptional regulator
MADAAVGRKRSEAARRAILNAALELMNEGSYSELTVDAIAGRAGVGKQTIYRWWSNKAEVVLEALSESARAISAAETGDAEGEVRAFFAATLRVLQGTHGSGPLLKALMAEAQLAPEFAPKFRTFIDTRRAALRAVLARHATAETRPRLETLVDMLFGALWYRLLVEHAPLNLAFGGDLAQLAASALRAPPAEPTPRRSRRAH